MTCKIQAIVEDGLFGGVIWYPRLGGGFKYFCIFTPISGNDPI